MPKPVKRRELIRRLRKLGWEGPHQRGSHPFMIKDEVRLTIPNPHKGDLDWSLVKRILRLGGITQQKWDSAK